MSYYLMHRGWMKNELFERDSFNWRNAWEWLIENAMFSSANGIARGQLKVSMRKLAKEWGWEEPRVRRFLSAAASRGMISVLSRRTSDAPADAPPDAPPDAPDGRVADAPWTIITICNYELYQIPTRVADAPPDAPPDAPADAEPTHIIKKKKEEGILELPNGSRQPARQIAEWMAEVWQEVFGNALTVPTRHNDNRIRTAKARFDKDFHANIDEWRGYLQRIGRSDFLMGRKTEWRADFDWVLKPSNMTKIMEGRYDGGTKGRDDGYIPLAELPRTPPPEIRVDWKKRLGGGAI